MVNHFQRNHTRDNDGRFIVPLPRKTDSAAIGESRSQAVRRFTNMERSLRAKERFTEVDTVIQEFMKLGHAEKVPSTELDRSLADTYYMPVHVVYKHSSTSTKVRAIFDASAKSSTGVSLNDSVLVGPTVHSQLVDVLIRFRTHRIAITADVSKMYRGRSQIEIYTDSFGGVIQRNPSQTIVWRGSPLV